MLIAEELAKDGAVVSNAFSNELEAIVATNKLTKIIETGTLYGTGSTRAIENGILKHGLQAKFYSIECNPDNFNVALKNTLGIAYLVNGISTPKHLVPLCAIFTDYPDDIVVDHQPSVREKLYMAEVNFDVPDDMLRACLSDMDFMPELVVLDSAGIMGTIEFEYLMTIVKGEFFLALDDTAHVKHYKTVQKIKDDERFTEVWATADKFGSKIYRARIS